MLIDIDHFLDHFLAFGFNFNYDYFIKGEYFLRTGNTYIVFHGLEYAIFFIMLAIFLKNKKKKMIITALALGMLSHLMIDIFLFPNPIRGYSIIYRLLQGFKVDMSGGVLD